MVIYGDHQSLMILDDLEPGVEFITSITISASVNKIGIWSNSYELPQKFTISVESCSRLASILAGQVNREVGPCRLHILSKSEVRVLQLQLSPLLLL